MRVTSLLAACVLGLAVGALTGNSLAASPTNTYGTKVLFKKAQPLRFPDFTLEYLGDRHVRSKQFPPGFLYRDFAAT